MLDAEMLVDSVGGASVRLVPDDAQPRYVRALLVGVCLVGIGYVAELVGKTAVPLFRIVGVLLAIVGMGLFFVAGVFYLAGYLSGILGAYFR
jgi:hypothetical protein